MECWSDGIRITENFIIYMGVLILPDYTEFQSRTQYSITPIFQYSNNMQLGYQAHPYEVKPKPCPLGQDLY